MRIGVVAPDIKALGWNEWSEFAGRADQLGVDAILLRAKGSDSLLLAATLAARTTWIRVVAEVEVSPGLHPVHLAERIAVADQCLGGRLTVVVRRSGADRDPTLLSETLAVLELALTSRPFSYEGSHWTIPAHLEVNSDASWSQISVTPTPAQFEVPIWLAGENAKEFSQREGYVWLAEDQQDDESKATSEVGRKLRPAIIVWSSALESDLGAAETATALAVAQRRRGVDIAFLALPTSDVNLPAILSTLATLVRPRVQLAELPEGIEAFWESTLPADSLEP
jgi:alkanesulfonate monooxygenase SsuD/methylene tetrahydromethanopterin reductase-like flavin-dependent oxidoreductase (luciferase family)